MNNKRYLVLVHFASKLTRENLTDVAKTVVEAIRNNLDNTAAVMTSEAAIAMVGRSAIEPDTIFRNIGKRMRSGDNLTVMEIGDCIMTSHPGLADWQK